MREKELERKLAAAVKRSGGIAPKFTSPGFDGMPDRIVLMPNGKVGFVEVKATGRKPASPARVRPLQIKRHEMLQALGFKVYVLDDAADIQGIIQEIGGGQFGAYNARLSTVRRGLHN